jgi:hypothetical protein
MSRQRTSSTGALALAQVSGIKPHKVQGRQLEEVREKDPDGRIVVHHRTVDTLGRMLRSGTISQEMHDAARDFQAAFIVAQLDPLRAIPILRVPGKRAGAGAGPAPNFMPAAGCTRPWRRWAAYPAPPARACGTWWASSAASASGRSAQGWGGRPVRHEQAEGILIGALGVLAMPGGRRESRSAHPAGSRS